MFIHCPHQQGAWDQNRVGEGGWIFIQECVEKIFKNLLKNYLTRKALTCEEASSCSVASSYFKSWSPGVWWGNNGRSWEYKQKIFKTSVPILKALIQMAVKKVYVLLNRIQEAGYWSTDKYPALNILLISDVISCIQYFCCYMYRWYSAKVRPVIVRKFCIIVRESNLFVWYHGH